MHQRDVCAVRNGHRKSHFKRVILSGVALGAALGGILTAPLEAQVPEILGYQGSLAAHGTNYSGTALMKFAVVDGGTLISRQATATATVTSGFITSFTVTDGGAFYTSAPAVTIFDSTGSGAIGVAQVSGGVVTGITVQNPGAGYTAPTVTLAPPSPAYAYISYWSNDGSSSQGGEPGGAVSVPVTAGIFTVGLGDTSLANMTVPLSAAVFGHPDVRLRIWVSTGGAAFQQLSPDQRVTAAGYSLIAAQVAGASVGTAALADSAVTTPKLANSAVTTSKIADGTISSADLAGQSVITSALADGSVTSPKISDGTITSTDLANQAVGTAKLADGAVTAAKLGSGAVGFAQLAANAVATGNIQDGTITDADVSASAGIAMSKISGGPGIEYAGLADLPGITTAITSAGSVTVNCPTAGFVLVTFTGSAVFGGDNTTIQVGVGTSTTSFSGYVSCGRLDGAGTLRFYSSFSASRVFSVGAGNNTFYALAQKSTIFDANNVNLTHLYLSAIFVPVRY